MRRLGYLIGAHGSAGSDALARRPAPRLRGLPQGAHRSARDLGRRRHAAPHAHRDDPRLRRHAAAQAVAILRGGTMNTVAASFGIRGATPRLLFELIDKHKRGRPSTGSPSACSGVGDAYGFIFGNGLIYNFLEAYYETGNPIPAVAASIVARGFRLGARRRAVRTPALSPRARERDRRRRDLGARRLRRRRRRCRHRADRPRLPPPSIVSMIALMHSRSWASTPTWSASSPSCRASARAHPCAGTSVTTTRSRRPRFYFDCRGEEMGYTVDGDTYSTSGELTLGLGPQVRFLRLSGDARGEEQLP